MSYNIVINDSKEENNYYINNTIPFDWNDEYNKAFKYLKSIGKLNNLENVSNSKYYFHDHPTQITYDEFEKFCELYDKDLSIYSPESWNLGDFIKNDFIQKLINSKNDKIIYWD